MLLAGRISASVNKAVRPASRVLALKPPITMSALEPMLPRPLDLRRDRMDVPAAIQRTVAISIIDSADRIEVQIRGNGTGLGSPSPAGLGTAMLDDTCLQWSLRDAEGGGAKLMATGVKRAATR